MKIVINACHGGFGLSHDAVMRYADLKGINLVVDTPKNNISLYYKGFISAENFFHEWDIPRNDPALVQVVEELGEKASDSCAKLRIVEIPANVEWEIDEYDGDEWVSEKHRRWS
jgi:hypothetical protein